ncbi:MAG: SIR2 family NAD-dependent protein deacylase [Gammaproteobacteria bacterium]
MASIQDLYKAIERRECVLFLGAGIHYPPPEKSGYHYPEVQRPPLGTAFSNHLADECLTEIEAESASDIADFAGLSEDEKQRREFERRFREEKRAKKQVFLKSHRDNLQRISWYYEVHRARSILVNKITEAVDTGKEPSPVVRALAEMDFPIIITTNYDRLFEKALRRFGKEPDIRIYDPKGNERTKDFKGLPNPDAPWLFKMHGCTSDPASIVVTDEDYIRFVMRMGDSEDFHPVPLKIRVQFKEWPTLFVGYSLLDYNLRLLFRTLRRRVDPAERPLTFSLDPFPDLLVLATYGTRTDDGAAGPLVSFIEQDSWRFVPKLYEDLLKRPMPK